MGVRSQPGVIVGRAVLCVLAVAGVVGLGSCRRSTSDTGGRRGARPERSAATSAVTLAAAKRTAVPAPLPATLDLGISFFDGGPDADAVVVVRLFSLSVRQANLCPQRPGRAAKPVLPVTVELAPGFWTQSVRVVKCDAGGAGSDAASLPLYLVSTAGTGKVDFGPLDDRTAMYRIAAATKPEPGTRLRAEAVLPSPWKPAVSAEVVVPAVAPDEATRLLRRAVVEERTGNLEALLKTAAELIRVLPGKPAGYWMQGQAFEGLRRRDEALAAYESALRVIRDSKRDPSAEPPVQIIRRIERLRAGTNSVAVPRVP